MTNIKEQVFDRNTLHSPGNGRDYIKVPDGEIYSINGLYCDAKGNVDRYGAHVKIIDIRWTVVVWHDCHVVNPDFSYRTERRLVFVGDHTDEQILAHYGYRVERDAEGYKNILPVASQEAAAAPVTEADVHNLIAQALRGRAGVTVSQDGTLDDPSMYIQFASGQVFFIHATEDKE